MNEQNLDNQTLFSVEEPYHLDKRKRTQSTDIVKKPPTLIYAVIALTVVVVLSAWVFIMFNGNKPATPIATATPTPTTISQSTSQIDQMMLELGKAIDLADPSKTALPFPPLADRITIEQSR